MDLLKIAEYLADSDNEIFVAAFEKLSDEELKSFAELSVLASEMLLKLNSIKEELIPEAGYSSEDIDVLASIATEYEASGDEKLIKQASLLDDVLYTIAVDPKAILKHKLGQVKKLRDLRKQFEDTQAEKEKIIRQKLDELNGVDVAKKAIEKSKILAEPKSKELAPLSYPLLSRHCPDHHGVGLIRIGDNVWQCGMDKKVYDYNTGYTLYNGNKVPATSVADQTDVSSQVLQGGPLSAKNKI